MAGRWLLKSEPGDYSFEDLERDGQTVWDGVGNNLALKHMRQVQPGDEAFYYHTGRQRAIVGIARVESEAYPDPDRSDERRVVFDVSPVRRLERPVTLDAIKARQGFEDWELVRIPRLSVMPVPDRIWSDIVDMSRA